MTLWDNMDEKKRKSVTFNPSPKIHHLHTWTFAYRAARKSNWEQAARDRHRFERRIERNEVVISPILSIIHRTQIFRLRFQE